MKILIALACATMVAAADDLCYNGKTNGKDYKGKVDKALTRSSYSQFNGKEAKCQKWSSNTPNKITGDFHEDHNYCRNPDNDKNGPWCYLEDYSSKWYISNGKKFFYGKGRRPYISNYGYCGKYIPEEGSIECKIKKAKKVETGQTPNSGTCLKADPRGDCFKDYAGDEEYMYDMPEFKEPDNRQWCINQCKTVNKPYAGLHRDICFCMDCYNDEESKCNRRCTDYFQNSHCGGQSAMNVYKV